MDAFAWYPSGRGFKTQSGTCGDASKSISRGVTARLSSMSIAAGVGVLPREELRCAQVGLLLSTSIESSRTGDDVEGLVELAAEACNAFSTASTSRGAGETNPLSNELCSGSPERGGVGRVLAADPGDNEGPGTDPDAALGGSNRSTSFE